MEVLDRLHSSLANSLENSFNAAYRDVGAELAVSDARVKDAEKRAQTAEEARQQTEVDAHALRHELSVLREEIRQDEVRYKQSEKASQRALQLDEKYDPRHILGDRSTSDMDFAELRMVGDRYVELYEQACTVIQASGALRHQVKRHRDKVTLLRAQLERRGPSSVPGSRDADPKKAANLRQNTVSLPPELLTTNPLKDPSQTTRKVLEDKDAAATASKATHEQSSSGSIRHDSDGKRLSEEQLESTSTSSDASTDELPAVPPATASTQFETLKRKRMTPEQPIPKVSSSARSSGKNNPRHPILVKSETLSSSPLRLPSPQPGPIATQDLDDVGDTVVTPTKRVRFHRDHSFSAPPDDRPAAMGSLFRDYTRNPDHRRFGTHDRSRALQPINGNLRNLSGPGQRRDKKRIKNAGFISRISSITEDGDENGPRKFAKGAAANTPQHKSSETRLSGLLEGTSPASRMLQVRATDASTPTHNRRSRSPMRANALAAGGVVEAASKPISKNSDVSRASPKPRVCVENVNEHSLPPEAMDQVQARPDEEPYRARPLQRLGLEHFKINPNHNHGLDYAYDEVIRSKDERKCISGCTRPGCCGDKFRAMARLGIPGDALGGGLDDYELLEEYLGRDRTWIDNLSPEDREKALVEAKARAISNRYGKHRHQHHRSGTPPGFWRAEMPGTQEIEDDREEARRREREKVEELYREAVRPGGRWTFADE